MTSRDLLAPLRGLIRRALAAICRSSHRHPVAWLVLSTALSIPAWMQVSRIHIDTNLIRLLPRQSPASEWTRKLDKIVSDGGYFSLILESDEPKKLREAVESAADLILRSPMIGTVEYTHPLDFVNRYKYLLLPEGVLESALDELIQWEAELNPFGVDLLAPMEGEAAADGKKTRADLEDRIREYESLTRYHQSPDGRMMGIIVRPVRGVGSFGDIRKVYGELLEIAKTTADEFDVWTGISGSMRNKMNEYDLIHSDLNISGTISASLIILFLIISFRSITVVPILIYPVAVGLLWSYAFVPLLVGSLNTITSFLLLVLFGTGVENPIHLVKRFQLELLNHTPEEALQETFLSTGPSVIVSGVTTAVPLFVLTVSDFRGFSEFGLIAGVAILVMMAALLVIMPASLALGARIGFIRAAQDWGGRSFLPSGRFSIVAALIVVVALGMAATRLSFDYDFGNLKAIIPQAVEVKNRHKKIYPRSLSPAALYVADDEEAMDGLLAALDEAGSKPGSLIGRTISVRDFAPTEEGAQMRGDLLAQIQEQLEGGWTRRIKDPESRRWIDDVKRWQPPDDHPAPLDIPDSMRRPLMTHDGSARYIIGIHPTKERKRGHVAMAFTEELYNLPLPEGVSGVVGETPIFAEILWIVTGGGPWLVFFTVLGVVFLILIHSRSVKTTVVIVLPLLSGVGLALGIMGAVGIKLNFFNVIIIPTLLGMGVDFGVHYYRRWRELGGDLAATQRELFEPLTTVTVTTMMGYSGMVFANHPGLQSIGIAACLGLAANLFTYVTLIPGMLRMLGRREAG